jgi:hypothetical protein
MVDDIAVRDMVERLRGGYRPSEDEASDWNVAVTMHGLRHQVGEPDLRWILPLVAEEDGPRAAFYLALLQPFSTRDDVRQLLSQRFETTSPYLKSQLLWRLLDDPDLPHATQARLFEFVMSDFAFFQKACVEYLGTPAAILPAALGRIADCPPTKRWIYLCCLPQYAEDQHAVAGLLTIAAGSADGFTALVARTLIGRFFRENH